ncbi:hypothetical protein K490DRAFT_65130 [Saccharata proteae CBS 121410]|uniref:Protection of telomeres protein 1 n=1 Tax=Saccharata proteae CBS 121410 TaxID=1314787 RepID=A0A9P4HTQ4_9PEZI|nr:hypothetical protein K490DRAFT_65130 [Saccharata proteae CBS 121410]
MSLKLPEGFVSLQHALATQSEKVNVIGVVQDFAPPRQTRGKDLVITFDLQDKSLTNIIQAPHPDGEVLSCRIFAAEADLPNITGIGDIVILRKVRMKPFAGAFFMLSNRDTVSITIPAKTIPKMGLAHGYVVGNKTIIHELKGPVGTHSITTAEQSYAIALHQALPPPDLTVPIAPNTDLPTKNTRELASRSHGHVPHPVRERMLIKDLKAYKYADLAAMVVKIHSNSYGDGEIYVTDYTTNEDLYLYLSPEEDNELRGGKDSGDDGDPFGYGQRAAKKWQGPYGKMTLQVKLWGPNAMWASSNLQPGDFVMLHNLHVKYDNQGGKLEGVIHEDRKYPEKVFISKLANHSVIETLQGRRRDYEKKQKIPGEAVVSKTAAKKKKKKAKEAEQTEISRHKAAPAQDLMKDAQFNTHVRCGYTSMTTTSSISYILNRNRPSHTYTTPAGISLTLPFINAKYRARVRVVDFMPPDLRDFSRSVADPTYNDTPFTPTPSTNPSSLISTPSQPKWEWSFCLLVEDASQPPTGNGTPPDRIPLLIHDKNAEGLLKMDACDLRKNRKSLNQLREKLFILWGDLAELKEKGQDPFDEATARLRSSRAFETGVMEYGVRIGGEDEGEDGDEVVGEDDGFGWRRMFQMFGTTIMD